MSRQTEAFADLRTRLTNAAFASAVSSQSPDAAAFYDGREPFARAAVAEEPAEVLELKLERRHATHAGVFAKESN